MAVALCGSTDARPRKMKTGTGKVTPVSVDTVDARTFAYIMGQVTTGGLVDYLIQQKGVDTTYMAQFVEGFLSTGMSEEDKAAQARIVGIEIAADVRNRIIPRTEQQIDSVAPFYADIFLQGFADAIAGKYMPISSDSANKVVSRQMEYYRSLVLEKKYGPNRIKGEEFLKANTKNKDVKTTPSGLQYRVLVAGNGEVPTATQKVKVNYEGHLIDGTEFDSSYKRGQPATFGCNQVIPGWTEALTMMPVGSKWELFIPSELAYGTREQQKIPPYSVLIFTVELLEVVK